MDRRVKQVIKMIKQSLALKPSEQGMAKRVNLSSQRLRQLFKKETGLSPIQFIRDLRAKKAAYLLRTSFLTIKEVAFHSGAGDISHFVRDFKKRYGVTPSEFRVRAERRSRQATIRTGKISE